jgi:hypothetical protein
MMRRLRSGRAAEVPLAQPFDVSLLMRPVSSIPDWRAIVRKRSCCLVASDMRNSLVCAPLTGWPNR